MSRMYCIVARDSLKLMNGNRGKLAAQAGHAYLHAFWDAEDVKILPELIVSTIQVVEGADKAAVSASWSGDTSLVVASAMKDLVTGGSNQAIVRL